MLTLADLIYRYDLPHRPPAVPCRECGQPMAVKPWRELGDRIVTCTNPDCPRRTLTFSASAYANVDLSRYRPINELQGAVDHDHNTD